MASVQPESSRTSTAPSDFGSVLALTTAIARGDPIAFGSFYELWFDRAYSLARSLTRRDESFCLDVVQDAMLRVVRALRPLPDRESLASWMRKTIHTTALDHLRRELRRRRREERAAIAAAAPSPAMASLEAEERLRWLEREIAALAPGDRALLAQRFVHGRTLETAGAALGLSGHAAHGRIRRLLEQLKAASRRIFP
ncbi:MAG: sigma-70 family RNA polymerase sigma factor [Planctomycetota bacterium]